MQNHPDPFSCTACPPPPSASGPRCQCCPHPLGWGPSKIVCPSSRDLGNPRRYPEVCPPLSNRSTWGLRGHCLCLTSPTKRLLFAHSSACFPSLPLCNGLALTTVSLGLLGGCEQGQWGSGGSEVRPPWVQPAFNHLISLSMGFPICKVILLWFLCGLKDKNALKHLAQLLA